MAISLKPLGEQVIVVTGASSGIGLATARAAIAEGAKVILAARNETALQRIVEPLQVGGREVDYVAADVGKAEDVKAIADKALKRFGRIDTWVNVAGVDVWGRLMDLDERDARRLFDTNYWGLVNGCKTAVDAMRGQGGAIINVGSVAGDRAFPLQGMYCASKHAVKAFTEALRIELAADRLPISVTLVKPASIGTPLEGQAKNLMKHEPRLPSPLYAPEDVAAAILRAAVRPMRDVNVGFAGWMITALGTLSPKLSDWIGKTALISAQQSAEPARPRQDNLHQAGPGGGKVRGVSDGRTIRPSAMMRLGLQPPSPLALLAIGGIGLIAMASAKRPSPRRSWVSRPGNRARYRFL